LIKASRDNIEKRRQQFEHWAPPP